MFPDILKIIALFDSFQASPACPFKCSITVHMSVEC